MLSDETVSILELYPYGQLTRGAQYRLIDLLQVVQRMTPDQLALALSEIRELKPIA